MSNPRESWAEAWRAIRSRQTFRVHPGWLFDAAKAYRHRQLGRDPLMINRSRRPLRAIIRRSLKAGL